MDRGKSVYDSITQTNLDKVEAGKMRCPDLSEALVAWIERTFPPPIVRPGVPGDTLLYDSGANAVARALRHQLALQNQEPPRDVLNQEP